jgi:hypothetical protein
MDCQSSAKKIRIVFFFFFFFLLNRTKALQVTSYFITMATISKKLSQSLLNIDDLVRFVMFVRYEVYN